MKKFILLFGGVLLLSSFTVTTLKSTEDHELKTWVYHCNDGTGKTGTFITSSSTTQEQAEEITKTVCAANRAALKKASNSLQPN